MIEDLEENTEITVENPPNESKLVESEGNDVSVILENGEEIQFDVDDDQGFSSYLLVAVLLEWKDVSFHFFSQIGKVPVYTEGEDRNYELCVPDEEALESITYRSDKRTKYQIEGRANVYVSRGSLFWLMVGIGMISVASLTAFLFAGSLQALTSFSLLSISAVIFFVTVTLTIGGFRSLWRSIEVYG